LGKLRDSPTGSIAETANQLGKLGVGKAQQRRHWL
jgi:hypothetical protein